jgi:L-alanine-DL-glutamate epimerase-like enolase superfamily enzyme
LDVYPELRSPDAKSPPPADSSPRPIAAIYVRVETKDGPDGLYGPISADEAFIIRGRLRPFLLGRDPLSGEALWDQMRGLDRHARSGQMMMAISAVDCALWDLRGKHFGVPVYRLLGGPTRERIRAYGSMGGHSTEPDKAVQSARKVFDEGFTAQKWFFRWGPADGAEGRGKNLALVRSLRGALGEEADLMFDCGRAWDVPYAVSMAQAMASSRPFWLEEPLQPERLEGYKRIKREGGVPLAAGEHLYTRSDVKPFLDAGVLDYLQVDPDWTGGITELVKICALAAVYDVKVTPHGHGILPAAHVVASQPPSLCPMIEFLFGHLTRMQFFHKNALYPENGWLTLPNEPGLGLSLDPEKIEETEDL